MFGSNLLISYDSLNYYICAGNHWLRIKTIKIHQWNLPYSFSLKTENFSIHCKERIDIEICLVLIKINRANPNIFWSIFHPKFIPGGYNVTHSVLGNFEIRSCKVFYYMSTEILKFGWSLSKLKQLAQCG